MTISRARSTLLMRSLYCCYSRLCRSRAITILCARAWPSRCNIRTSSCTCGTEPTNSNCKSMRAHRYLKATGGGSKDDASCTDNINNENPAASLIKQNVSSVANLVYEGVKTVGDKVATLSRHVSGSSDPNEIARPDADDENFEELEIDELYPKKSCLAVATTPGSLNSSTSSEHDLLLQYQRCPSERINLLVRSGSSALNTELWTWGDTKYGQLGGNDAATTTRQRPRQVTMLNHCGVKKITCGDNHTLAMTLDGRVFTWEIPNLKDDHKLVGIFCSQDYKCCTSVLTSSMSRSIVSCLDESLIEAQVYLTETLLTQQHLVAQLQKKSASVPTLREFASAFDELCRYHRELLSLIALHAQELTYFHEQAILNSLDTDHYPRLVIVANVEECVAVYKAYLQALCDLTAISGLSQIAKVIDVLPTLLKHFQNKLKCDVNSDITNEALVVFALHLPLLQASSFINGDVYEGYFKDGLPHGHGVKKEGHFMASAASIYIGEWSCGVKQGYGVMDDIKTGYLRSHFA
ncbi:unnamed protein product [Trichogramma brassicae]|uniref:DH domain-containing protein n=1 Tax=Trichogramma brassicae TaxID=86971 RepID=A0A6H5ILW9_9HYME|nr:unnamed protein product [Trichogramma brassicae]